MTPDGANLQPLIDWIARNWLAIIAISVGLLFAFRYARPLVRAVARRLLASRVSGPDAKLHAEETEKRVATIEELFVRIVRSVIVLTLILLVLTALDLLPILASLTIIGAAITLAGQSIVLDYLMGILILLEGPYYRGDWIVVGGLEGTVEDVGLRRTVLRDSTGTVHSISNGQIRTSSNMTRVFATLVVEITMDPAADIDMATSVIDATGRAMADDPAWRERLLEPPHFERIADVTESGLTLRVSGRVRAADRWSAPGELRRLLLRAFAEHGIVLSGGDRVAASPGPAPDPEA
jgi:small conductance mechanosensitive channel